MAGTQIYTHFQTGKETNAGTAVAATRRWYPDGTGVVDIDNMLSIYQGNRGRNVQATGGVEKGEAVSLQYRSNPDIGLQFDELPFVLGQLDGGNTATGALANKTWTVAPSMTADNAQESYTIEVGGDTQNWEYEYAQARSLTIGASVDSMTTLEMDIFARQAIKSTKTSLTSNVPLVGIPGYLWSPKFATAQAGLAGASASTNFLLDWSATFQSGRVPRFYPDGAKYFGQSVQSKPQDVALTLHVESTALAVTEFYDKWRGQTIDFMPLPATGPTLGSGTYSATWEVALLYTKVVPIGSEQDGVNIYEISARNVDDPTWGAAQSWSVACSLPSVT